MADPARPHLGVAALCVLFGMGAWVSINGLWVEMPLLIHLPEGWALASYLVVIMQIANIGPVAHALLRHKFPLMRLQPSIYFILSMGCLASLLLVFFWDETTYIGQNLHSTSLLILVFFLSVVTTTSSVLYLPYMSVWKSKYLPFYSMGTGLSGLIPALVGMAQGTTASSTGPNFSVAVFFLTLFLMMVISVISFILLDNWKIFESEKDAIIPSVHTGEDTSTIPASKIQTVCQEVRSTGVTNTCVSASTTPEPSAQSTNSLITTDPDTFEWPKRTFYFLIFCEFCSGFLSNGFLPSIQTYSIAPYGDFPYFLVSTIRPFASPLAGLTTALCRRAPPALIAGTLAVGGAVAALLTTAAAMSPNPPLVGTTEGSAIIVTLWVVYSYLLSFTHIEGNNLLRQTGRHRANRALFMSGAAMQVGSLLGAVFSFLLVNVAKVFHE